MMYKVINHGYAPFLINQLESLPYRNSYNTRSNYNYQTPFPRVDAVKISFLYNAVKIWNSLHPSHRNANSISILKFCLTNDLLTNY